MELIKNWVPAGTKPTTQAPIVAIKYGAGVTCGALTKFANKYGLLTLFANSPVSYVHSTETIIADRF